MDPLIQARLILSIATCLDITEDQYNSMNTDLKENHKMAVSNLKNFKIFSTPYNSLKNPKNQS